MNFESALTKVNAVMVTALGRRLNDAELALFKGAWYGQTYDVIAKESGYSPSYITRVVGPKFWKNLSQALGEKVSKTSFRSALEQLNISESPILGQHDDQEESPDDMTGGFSDESHGVDPRDDWSVPAPQTPAVMIDWGEAPDVTAFYGRQAELDTLTQWIVGDRCRLVSVLGMGGIGKTALTAKFVDTLALQATAPFEQVIWRSLRNAPPLSELLGELVPFVSNQQDSSPTIRRLLYWLQQSRCLIVLDNMETILQEIEHAGYFRTGYADYGDLLRLISEARHQSCVVLTSREKPAIVGASEGIDLPVRSLQLAGSPEAARALIESKGLVGTDTEKQQLSEHYRHSPLALKIVATSIQSLFEGQIHLFLTEDILVFNGLQRLLDQQFQRLGDLEKTVMIWLAINREWTSIADLAEDIQPTVTRPTIIETLESLSWRSLIEQQQGRYTQQPVVMEYVTRRYVEQVIDELKTGNLKIFLSYAVIKTTVKDYVRLSQVRLILKSITHFLTQTFSPHSILEQHIRYLLEILQQQQFSGYGIGNLINLCIDLGIDLTGFDFSKGLIYHACLHQTQLPQVNFEGATFINVRFIQTFGSVLAIDFSPDGQFLTASDTNGQIWLWNIDDLDQPYLAFQGHGDWACALAFSPDGKILASGGDENYDTLKLWDVQTGHLLKTIDNPGSRVRAIAWSPDQSMIAGSGVDGKIHVWNPKTGHPVRKIDGHANKTEALAWQPVPQANGTFVIATGSADETIKLWDSSTDVCLTTIDVEDSVFSVAWSPDGCFLASGTKQGAVDVWDGQTGDHITRLNGHRQCVWGLSWHSNGYLLASGGDDQRIRVWDIASRKCLRILQAHENPVRSLKWKPNSKEHSILSSSWSKLEQSIGSTPGNLTQSSPHAEHMTVPDHETNEGVRSTLPSQPSSLESATRDHIDNDYLLASGSFDQTVRLWNPKTGSSIRVLKGYRNALQALAWHPREQQLASGGHDCMIRLWNPQTGECEATLSGHTGPIWAIAWSSDGTILASAGDDYRIYLWNLQTKQIETTLDDHSASIWGLAWHPKRPILASVSHDQTIRLWNIATRRCEQVLAEHNHFVRTVAWSPNGELLATGSYDRTLRLWHAETGECLNCFHDPSNWVWQMAFSPDGKTLATGSSNGIIKLWDVAKGALKATLTDHQTSVWALAWAPDGQQLISASHDHTLRIWRVSDGHCLHILNGHTNLIWRMVLSPDGKTVASCGTDETIRLWDTSTGRSLSTLRPKRPYEGMNITNVKGLTEAQLTNLKALGAITVGDR